MARGSEAHGVNAPLADVRVLAVEQYGAGPWATMQLADLGAEVIKLEDPANGGDVGRYVPPFQTGEDSLFFETLNRGKRSISLDLRHPRGRQTFEDIVRNVDVVFSNLRGDQPSKLRLTYEDLKGLNPRIVCCSLSGFGATGPRACEGGYDYIMQALAGWMDLTGPPGGAPERSGLPIVDLSGGYVAAIAILAGIVRVRRDGVGCDCDVSLFETALAELLYIGTWTATKGYTPPRRVNSGHPSMVPFQNFRTSDGWIVVAAPKPKLWSSVCDVIERPELRDDERFLDFGKRDKNRDALLEILDQAFSEKTTTHWIAALTAAGVPCGPINDVAAGLQDPQTISREMVVEYEHPNLGTVRQVGTPFHFNFDLPQASRGPFRGEHTEDVLRTICGYNDATLDALARAGVFGTTTTITDAA
jgi:crotonobetainyl-CoA:carnitine CoA-transferase CaiB-like acyl-CoA transferase